MKKLILTVIISALTFGVYAQKSTTVFKFDNFATSKYAKVEIEFGGEYTADKWKFKDGNQYIYFTMKDLEKVIPMFEESFNKAIKWDSIADANNVDKLEKKMEGISFRTSGGMIEDSGYESVGPHDSRFDFFRQKRKDGSIVSHWKCRVYQSDEYNVRSSFFWFPIIDVRKESEVKEFNKFLDFLKNSRGILEEKIAESKSVEDKFN